MIGTRWTVFGWVYFLGLALLPAQTADAQAPKPEPAETEVFSNPVTRGDANTQFQAVSKRLRAIDLLRAGFRQQKRIEPLRRPLLSSGDFLFAPKKGVVWHTREPFDSVFIIMPRGIFQREEGREILEINAQDQPAIAGFTSVFLALFGGDIQELEKSFDLYFEGDLDRWSLGLKPRGRILKRIVESIVLHGGAAVDQVWIREPRGNTTRVTFDLVLDGPLNLSEEEALYFEQ